MPLTETERIPGTRALPLFPSVSTKAGAPARKEGVKLRRPSSKDPHLRPPPLAALGRVGGGAGRRPGRAGGGGQGEAPCQHLPKRATERNWTESKGQLAPHPAPRRWVTGRSFDPQLAGAGGPRGHEQGPRAGAEGRLPFSVKKWPVGPHGPRRRGWGGRRAERGQRGQRGEPLRTYPGRELWWRGCRRSHLGDPQRPRLRKDGPTPAREPPRPAPRPSGPGRRQGARARITSPRSVQDSVRSGVPCALRGPCAPRWSPRLYSPPPVMRPHPPAPSEAEPAPALQRRGAQAPLPCPPLSCGLGPAVIAKNQKD